VATNPTTGFKAVEYGNLVAPIIEAIKELSAKVDALFQKYADQSAKIEEQEKRLEELEKKFKKLENR
jgi:peptidoglycan hydrolase CwlO-like protein